MKEFLKFGGKVLLVLAVYKVVRTATDSYIPASIKPWLP